MKVFDMHIHAFNQVPDPQSLLRNMETAGVWGGCVFSNYPENMKIRSRCGTDFQTRMAELEGWTRESDGRLLPVLWIHPYEDGAVEKAVEASERGVVAFKMICSDYYVYEDRSMELLTRIASLNKPVIFHSGILYSGNVSAKYNRPINWEALMGIPNIRFSMGHCSWPWYDECLALYGELRDAKRSGANVECYLDLTPGTPPAWREDMFNKLFSFASPENILFGTDCNAAGYNATHARAWLERDGAIMDRLGVSQETRENIYYHNLLRFLNRT